MMYFPVSPVAPPKRTTFDLETKIVSYWMMLTLGDGMAESGEGYLTEDLDFLHHL